MLSFPILSFYDLVIPIEWNAVSTVLKYFPERIAILGSGPLPITAMSIADRAREVGRNLYVLNVDCVKTRVQQSMEVCHKLEGYSNLHHQVADVRDAPEDLREFDAIYFAALVGSTREEKEDLLLSVVGRMRKGAILITRSSHSLKTLMYPVSQESPGARCQKAFQDQSDKTNS